MKEILKAIDKTTLKEELQNCEFLRKTNKSSNEIYIFDSKSSPQLMLEIGRLREESFRNAGGGTGEEIDIDKFDTAEVPCQQLIVWDPIAEEILGGYRFIYCRDLGKDNIGKKMAMTKLFNLSDKFIEEYLDRTIELGRSFVQPSYQSSKMGAKSLYALDNLWDGLGALMVKSPEIEFFLGKVTMYESYSHSARNLLFHFFDCYFNDPENLLEPIKPLITCAKSAGISTMFDGLSYKDGYKKLSVEVRKMGENIPPLINAYMSLSPSMKTFGTVINDDFGYVFETGILIRIYDIYSNKVTRHVSSYLEEINDQRQETKIRFS